MNASNLRATDTLANERTYLAYVRTALSFVAFGFVIARFSLYVREISLIAHVPVQSRPSSTIFGVAMSVVGIAIGIYGGYRYVSMNAALYRNELRPLSPIAAITGAAMVAVIGIIVAIDLYAFR